MTAARPAWAWPAGLVAAVAAAYANSFSGPFLFDDAAAIVDQPAVHDLGAAVRALPADLRPVTTLTLAANYAAGGLDVWGYHAANLAVHAAAAVTLYGLVRRTLLVPRCRDRVGPAAGGLAFAVALLWAVHPLQTESVTYVIQRAQALAGLFALLTLLCLNRGATAGRPGWWYAAAVAACAVGMGSKQDAVVIPVLAVWYDRVFLAGSRRGVARRWGVHAALFGTWVVLARSVLLALGTGPGGAAAATGAGAAGPPVTAGFGLARITPWQYLLTQAEVIPHYLRLAAWPDPLCLDYADWPVARAPADVGPGLAAVGLLVAATGWAAWRRPAAGFLGGWFFLTLAPTSSLMPIDDVAVEHRMYLPLAAVAAGAVVGGWVFLRRLGAGRWAGPAAVGITAVALTAATAARNDDYRSADRIWGAVVAVRPDNWRAHHNLGNALARAGRPAAAADHFAAAVRLRPNALDHALLAQTLLQLGREDEAVPHLREAVRLIPQPRRSIEPLPPPAALHFNLGQALARRGEWAEAVESLTAAVRADPEAVPAHAALGQALDRVGRFDEAVGHWRRAADLDPGFAPAVNTWAAALLRRGDPGAAEVVARRGLAARPADPLLLFNLAQAVKAQGRGDEARALYDKARRLAPGWPAAAATTARRLATAPDPKLRDPAEAVRLGEQAVQATGERDPVCLDALAVAYAAAGRGPDAARAAEAAKRPARAGP